MPDIIALLRYMIKINASDLHLKVGSPPMYRVDGKLYPAQHPSLKSEDTMTLMEQITPDPKRVQFDTVGAADFSYSIPDLSRFRVNVFHQRGSVSLAIRSVRYHIPTFEELRLPPGVKRLSEFDRGLILVTGVTGSGKSSTIAAMLECVNAVKNYHIITIEDPVEYLHKDNKCIFNQLEVGIDIASYSDAIRYVLRQDPDVILIGEMRDRESVEVALAAAETGHLVFSTLHTSDAKQTLNRILHFFGPDEEPLILTQLSLNFRGVVSQRLLPHASGKGRLPAVEILVNTPIVTKLISKGEIANIKQAMQNREDGMQTFNQHLVELYRAKEITLETGLSNTDDEAAFKRNIQGRFTSDDRAGIIGNF